MTTQHDDARPLTRRTLAKGAAWSVPVIAAASAAPAIAASSLCQPSLRFSGGMYYSFGTIYSTSGNTTNQYLTVGGETYVNNLPLGVTVTQISYNFWFQNKQGQNSSGPGVFWMGNSTSDQRSTCSGGTCAAPWVPTAGSGFDPTVTNTSNNVTKKYPDDAGSEIPSWDINMSWSAARDSHISSRYTATSAGCRDFDSGPSSKFRVNYKNVAALSAADERNGKKTIKSFVVVKAVLSNGETLEEAINVVYTN